MAGCSSDEAEDVVRRFSDSMVVIGNTDWKAVRSLRPASRETKLLPDASNLVPFLYNALGGSVPDSLVEALRYVLPSVSDLQLVADRGVLAPKLATEDGAVMTQATMPSSLLKRRC